MIPMREESKVRATVLSMRVLLLAALAALLYAAPAVAQTPKVLVYHEATGTPHPSTAAGVTAIKALRRRQRLHRRRHRGLRRVHSGEPRRSTPRSCSSRPTGDVLTPEQESAFQAYIQAGGGFVGIHDAARRRPASAWFTVADRRAPELGQPDGRRSGRSSRSGTGAPGHQGPADRVEAAPTSGSTGAQNPAGNVHAVASLRERSYRAGHGRQRLGPPDLAGAVTTTAAAPSTPAWAAHGRELRRDRLPPAPARRPAVDRRPGARRLQGDDRRQLHGRAADRAERPGTSRGQIDQIGEPHGLVDRARRPRLLHRPRRRAASCRPDHRLERPGHRPRLGHDPRLRPAKRRRRVKLAGDARRLRQHGRRRRAGQGRGGPARHRAGPGLRARTSCVYLHYTPHSKDRPSTRGSAERRVSRFTFDQATGKLDLGTREGRCSSGRSRSTVAATRAAVAWDFDKGQPVHRSPATTTRPGVQRRLLRQQPRAELQGRLRSRTPAAPRATPTTSTARSCATIHPEPRRRRTRSPTGNLFTGKETDRGRRQDARREIYVMGVRNPARICVDQADRLADAGWVGPDAGAPSADLGPGASTRTSPRSPKAGNHGWPYCMGNNQPYRDRRSAGPDKPLGLVRLRPPEERVAEQQRPGRTCRRSSRQQHVVLGRRRRPGATRSTDDRRARTTAPRPTLSQPFLAAGGGQATMPGPFYRYDAALENATKFPEFWDRSGSSTTTTGRSTARAVGLDADTVDDHKPPKTAVDITGIIGKTALRPWA